MGQCYGFFEIPSVTAAIDAVDIMCKTADVEMITWEKKSRRTSCDDHYPWRCIRCHTSH